MVASNSAQTPGIKHTFEKVQTAYIFIIFSEKKRANNNMCVCGGKCLNPSHKGIGVMNMYVCSHRLWYLRLVNSAHQNACSLRLFESLMHDIDKTNFTFSHICGHVEER